MNDVNIIFNNEQLNHNLIGNKSYNLMKLKSLKSISIPNSLFITTNFFSLALKENNINIDNNNKLSTEFIDIINKLYITPILKYEIDKIINYYSEVEDLILRSSFLEEDGYKNSNAGSFKSVKSSKNINDIWKSLKIVWNSYFENKVINKEYKLNNDINIPILVQNYIAPNYMGVAFSRDPISSMKTTIIEGAESKYNSIVNGGSNHFTIYKSKNSKDKINEHNELNAYMLNQLHLIIETIDNLEEYTKSGVDLEWIIDKNNIIHVVQVRPITNTQSITDYKFFNMDDKNIKIFHWPKFYENLISSHYKKRYWLKDSFNHDKNHIYNLGLLYIEKDYIQKENYEDLISYLTNYIKSKKIYLMYKLRNKKYDIIINFNDLKNHLNIFKYSKENIIIWISEFHTPKVSGLITKNDEGYFIEYIKGDLAGLKYTQMDYSTINLDFSNKIINQSKKYNKYYFDFDENNNSMKKSNFDDKYINIDKNKLSQLSRLMNQISHKFPNSAVEWVITEDDTLKIFDSSIMNEDLPQQKSNVFQLISSGNFEGHIMYIPADDMNTALEESLTDVSVSMDNNEKSEHTNNPYIRSLIKKINDKDSNIIVYSEYPAPMFSYISQYVSGFIFQSGSLLSHLSIILREQKVPAVIYENNIDINKYYTIKNGDIYGE